MDRRICSLTYFSFNNVKSSLFLDQRVNRNTHLFSFLQEYYTTKKIYNNIEIINFDHKNIFNNKKLRNILGINNNDTIFFLISTRASIWRIKRRLHEIGFEYLTSYLIVPGLANPRWFFPFNKKIIKKSGNIVKPSKIRSVLAWRLMRILNLVGLPQLPFPVHLILSKKQEVRLTTKGLLNDLIQKRFNREDLDFILYTGAYGYYQKFTAQIMDKDGEIIAYAKIGQTKQAKARINQEANILKYLDNTNLSTIYSPKIIDIVQLPGTSDRVMLQTPTPYDYKRWSKVLTSKHVDSLVELFLKTSNDAIDGKIVLSRLRKSFLKIDQNSLSKHFREVFSILGISLEKLPKYLMDKKIILGLSHGDFSPWNIYLGSSGLYIFDWELSMHRIPLWDLFNFIIHSEIQIFSKKPKAILNLLINENSPYASLIKQYQSNFKKNIYIDKNVFLSIYLYEICLYYLDYCVKQNTFNFEVEPHIIRIIRTAAYILDEVLKLFEN